MTKISISEMLKKNYPEDKPWLAFAKWYLEARGFDMTGDENQLVDGAHDGGIDVIATPRNGDTKKIYVIQSKYVRGTPQSVSLVRFASAVEALTSSSSRVFEDWLETVHERHKRQYKRLRTNRKFLEFILITTARLRPQDHRSFKKIGVTIEDQAPIRNLFISFVQGQTPRVEKVRLRSRNRILLGKTSDHRLWCYSIQLRELCKAYEKWGDDLFAGNVRHALRNQNASKVKSGIKETLRSRPEEFIYFHNGITVVSKSANYRRGILSLESPSIVNGAQTVSCVGKLNASSISPKAMVILKLIEVCGETPFEKLETDIAIASNTQNKVDFSDLTVAEPALVDLEKGFRRHLLFLERKRGSTPPFRPYLRISKERLVQLMASVEDEAGSARAKKPQELFKKEDAKALLRQYANRSSGLDDAMTLAKLDSVLRGYMSYELKHTQNRSRIAYFAIFSAYVLALKATGSWRFVRSEFARDVNFKKSEIKDHIKTHIRYAARVMLAISGVAKKNEPAFYKSAETVGAAVQKVVKKLRPLLRSSFR
ncbi:MAG: AIPR family protein [Oligoflexales bacterium]